MSCEFQLPGYIILWKNMIWWQHIFILIWQFSFNTKKYNPCIIYYNFVFCKCSIIQLFRLLEKYTVTQNCSSSEPPIYYNNLNPKSNWQPYGHIDRTLYPSLWIYYVFIIGDTTMILESIGLMGTRAFYTVGTVENKMCRFDWTIFYLKLCGLGFTVTPWKMFLRNENIIIIIWYEIYN